MVCIIIKTELKFGSSLNKGTLQKMKSKIFSIKFSKINFPPKLATRSAPSKTPKSSNPSLQNPPTLLKSLPSHFRIISVNAPIFCSFRVNIFGASAVTHDGIKSDCQRAERIDNNQKNRRVRERD